MMVLSFMRVLYTIRAARINTPPNNCRAGKIREAVAGCEAYARPARATRSLRAPHRHDFDARAFTRALYAGSQNHAGPANLLSRDSRLSGLGLSLHRLTAAAPTAADSPRPQHAATLQDAIRLYSDHYNPLQAKCNLIRGKLRRARSNAPQRFEASSWASCRTTAEASSFCRTSSTQMSRSRVTFVTLPATPRPVPLEEKTEIHPM